MKNDAQLVIRVPQELADRLKAYTERLERDLGVPVSVATATRKLLEAALEQAGQGPEASSAKRPRKR